MKKETHFQHQGRSLIVGAISSDNEYQVRVFENGKPVTAAVYSVAIETEFDGKMRGFPISIVDRLMEQAERDVVDGIVGLLPA